MMEISAASIGESLHDVDTPALILDLDAFERNCERLRQALAGFPVNIRPHAKSHKCPEIARRQIAMGAVGICCQKVSEAQAFIEAGIQDILVSNQVVGAKKIERLCALAKRARVSVCVDHQDNALALHEAAVAAGIRLSVLMEIDVGAHRCGVAPGAPALALAQAITGMAGLRFEGLQAYHGAAQHMRTHDERQLAITAAVGLIRETRDLLLKYGIVCEKIAGAGTGSFLLEAASNLYSELQVGSYVFMDVDYARNDQTGSDMPQFEHSLFVLTTVMSLAGKAHAVVDAGLKASSVDSGLPVIAQRPGVHYARASDEHGVLRIDSTIAEPLRLGQKLKLIPGHCDPTVNLYDELIVLRGERVEALWPISARGALL